jgi:anti-anti-sigma factor
MAEKRAAGAVAVFSLSIRIIHDRNEARLLPIGEIDVHSASTFLIAGEQAVAEMPAHLVIDLSQVTFLDSSGVRGVQTLVTMSRLSGVPCSVVGRDVDGLDSDVESVVVWSGETTRVVPHSPVEE